MTATGARLGESAAASGGREDLAAAHRDLLADETLQFRFETADPPPPPPDWLKPLADFLASLGPLLTYVFWGGVGVLVLLVVIAIVREILQRLPAKAKAKAVELELPAPEFRPTQARARALLEEADRLAKEGRFSEAARVLLHRSIEDMERVFPISISPAMTSREIGRLEPLSSKGRDVFTQIARAVETSLFGGRALDQNQYGECRRAYESFAFEGGRR